MNHYTDGAGRLMFSNPAPDDVLPSTDTDSNTMFGQVRGTNCLEQLQCQTNCSLHVVGSGFAPNMTLQPTAHSNPLTLAPIQTDGNGSFATSLAIPDGALAPGQHMLELTGTGPDGKTYLGDLLFDVSTRPVISNVHVARSVSTVTVTWNTDQLTDSQVVYGPAGATTNGATVDTTLGTEHSVQVDNVPAGTSPHFRAISVNAFGLMASSPEIAVDSTPATPGGQPPATSSPAQNVPVPASASHRSGTAAPATPIRRTPTFTG